MNENKDMLGQTIKGGDFIAYGTRSGNTGALNIGLVDDAREMKIFTSTGRRARLCYTSRCVVIDADKVPDEISAPMIERRAGRARRPRATFCEDQW